MQKKAQGERKCGLHMWKTHALHVHRALHCACVSFAGIITTSGCVVQKMRYLQKSSMGKEIWQGNAETFCLHDMETNMNATSQRLWVFHIVRIH